MQRLCKWLLACLFCLGVFGSPVVRAALCSQVFPQNATASGVVLDLAGLMDGQTYVDFPNTGAHYSSPGTWYYNNGTLGTWDSITVKAGATTWLFFDGDLTLQPQSSLNPYSTKPTGSGGNPEDLIIIVRGNLAIGTKNDINALIYATGNVTLQPQSSVLGAITAQGTITLDSGASVTYDPYAASTFNLPGACSDGKVHHYQLSYSSHALTCQAHSVTVTACSNADCTTTYTGGTSSLTLSPGGTPISFVGSASTTVSVRTATVPPTPVDLAVSGSNPAPAGSTLCRIDGGAASTNCSLTFHDSGFIFDVPHLLAGKPQTGIALQAVRKDNATQRCVPAFGPATRTLQFWSDYADLNTGSMPVHVNGGPVSTSETAPTSLALNFDSTATAYLAVRYDDAGLMQLNARFDGTWLEAGLLMLGSDQFVSKPYGLHISTPSDSTCTAADLAGCSVLRTAGDSFPLTIRAVAWQADGEALTEAALRDNPTTPNFQLNGIALNSMLVEPSVASGGVAGTFYRHAADGTRQAALISYDHAVGASTTLQVGQSEVGIYRITATPPAGTYHTLTVSGGASALIGRFTPAYLGVTSTASLTPACGAFSYQGQSINFSGGQPGIVVTGYNRQGAVTQNYDREPFWRLASPERQAYSFSNAGKPGLVTRLQSLGVAQSLAVEDSGSADGSRAFDWRADSATARLADALLWQLPSPPTTEDLPFVLSAAGEHVQLKVAAAELTDLDGICYRGSAGSSATCQDFSHALGGTEVRLGRLRIDAASGPGNQSLDLPYWLESWQASASGPVFGATTGDSCSTQAALGDVVLSDFTGDLQASHFPTPPGTLEAATGTPLPTGVIRLPAPNRSGSVLASLSGLNGATPVLPWLLFDWDGNGTPEAPAARATFGEYSGTRALIFRREVYR